MFHKLKNRKWKLDYDVTLSAQKSIQISLHVKLFIPEKLRFNIHGMKELDKSLDNSVLDNGGWHFLFIVILISWLAMSVFSIPLFCLILILAHAEKPGRNFLSVVYVTTVDSLSDIYGSLRGVCHHTWRTMLLTGTKPMCSTSQIRCGTNSTWWLIEL